jgi:hypothetical protein
MFPLGVVNQQALGSVATPPIIEAVEKSQGTTTSITLTAPAGITAGDLLVIICGNSRNNWVAPVYSSIPAGWTVAHNGNVGGSYDCGLFSMYKIADGTETDISITVDYTTAWVGFYLRISGANASTPVWDTGAIPYGYVPGYTHPDYTLSGIPAEITTPNTLLLAFGGVSKNITYSVSGDGWSMVDQGVETNSPGEAVFVIEASYAEVQVPTDPVITVSGTSYLQYGYLAISA